MPPLRPRDGDRQRKMLRRVLVDFALISMAMTAAAIGVLAAAASIATSPTADRNVVGTPTNGANAAPLVAPTKKDGRHWSARTA